MNEELYSLSLDELVTKINETNKEIEKIQLEQKAMRKTSLFGAIIVLILVLGLPQPLSGILFIVAIIYVFIPNENESRLSNRLFDLQNYLCKLQEAYRNK